MSVEHNLLEAANHVRQMEDRLRGIEMCANFLKDSMEKETVLFQNPKNKNEHCLVKQLLAAIER